MFSGFGGLNFVQLYSLYTSFESFIYAWSQCVCLPLGPLVSRAHCWRQLMPRTGTRLVMAIFRCDPYDPSMKCASASNARDLGTIERLQGFDSQVFFHGRPFARESLQPPWTAWNSLDFTWELLWVGLAMSCTCNISIWIRMMSLRVPWHHRSRSSPLARRQNWTLVHSYMLPLAMDLLPIFRASSSIFQHLVASGSYTMLHSTGSAFFLHLGSCPFCCCVTLLLIVCSFFV